MRGSGKKVVRRFFLGGEWGRLESASVLCDIHEMESYDITFVDGMTALGGVHRCRIQRMHADSTVVLLRSLEDDQPPLLLGCVGRMGAEVSPVPGTEEKAALGIAAENGSEEVCVFCRMGISDDDPLSAGFDLSRLVLAAPASGRGVEAARPGWPFLPLRGQRRKS